MRSNENLHLIANRSNRHPVDRLADIREQIKRLKAEEEAIKQEVLAGQCDRLGDEFVAVVKQTEREILDSALVRKHFGPKGIKPFLRISVAERINLVERVKIEELFS